MDANATIEVAQRIEDTFRRIETTRMDGVPILNRALRVEVVGLQRFGDAWLCVLLTPWFMNVMLMNCDEHDPDRHAASAVGEKCMVAFPAGPFEMIHGSEPGLGAYRMCSLFSPVLEFADHDSAVLTARTALAMLLETEAADAAVEEPDMAMIWRGERPRPKVLEDGAAAGRTPAGTADHDGDDIAPGDKAERASLSRRRFLTGRLPAGKAS